MFFVAMRMSPFSGFATLEDSLAGKWLELLKEIAPHVARVAFLFNPATATYFEYYLNIFKASAASLGVKAIAAPVQDVSELESIIAANPASRMVALLSRRMSS